MASVLMGMYMLSLFSVFALPRFRGIAGVAEGMLLMLAVDSLIAFSMTSREASKESLTSLAVSIGMVGVIEAVFAVRKAQRETTAILEARVKRPKAEE